MNERLAGIAVVGRGKVTAEPDLAHVVFAAHVEAATAADASSDVTSAVNAMLAVIEEAGVDERDRQTTTMSFSSQRHKPGRPPRYHAFQRLSARLRDLDTAGALVQRVLAAGGDNAGLDGFTLDIEDPEPYRDAARQHAMHQAKRKAHQLASLAGRPLGPVLAVSESASHTPLEPWEDMQVFAARSMSAASPVSMEDGVPVAIGELSIEVNIAVEFAWGD